MVQVAAVVEGCHDAGIGSDPHRRGHGVQLRLSPASQFQCRSARSQWNFLCVGHSIRHKICYQVRLRRLIWCLIEVELRVQIYPGGCPGTDVHPGRQRWLSAGRGGARADVGTVQVWQFWGRVARHPPRPATGPQPCVGPPSPTSLARSNQCPLLWGPARPLQVGTKPFLAKSLGDSFRESPFRQKRSKIKQAAHVSDFAGAAQSAGFSPCLSLYPFSPPPHQKQPALIGPPILHSPLHLSLPSLHPASCPLDTPAPQCSHAPLPRLPPSPLAVVTWCLNSSSLNSATST